MRLLEITICNFRGFGPLVSPIKLDGDLLLFFGPNGFGKTSIAEAVEWLFYGTTKRRLRGDGYSRSEYAGSFANAHGGRPTFVEALVAANGLELRLGRRITISEQTETLINGVRAPFNSISLAPAEAVYPVVAQHGLQTFIHSKPKDRRDAISAALGLDELTSLKSALDSARTSFQRTPPTTVKEARQLLAQNAGVLSRMPSTNALGLRWLRTPFQIRYEEDVGNLLSATKALLGRDISTVDEALAGLREKRAAASKAVFDVSKLEPAVDVNAAAAAVQENGRKWSDAFSGVEKAIVTLVAGLASTYATALLEFWGRGLSLATGDQCPMCEEDTLNIDKRAELKGRIDSATQSLANNRALTQSIEAARRAQGLFLQAVASLGAPDLGEQDRAVLTRLISDQPAAVMTVLDSHRALSAARQQVREAAGDQAAFLEGCQARLSDPRNASSVVAELGQHKQALASPIQSLVVAFTGYVAAWSNFEKVLSARIASDELVAQIDAVGKSLRNEARMRLLDRYDQILDETQTLIRAVEGQIQKKQSELLATRGAEVKACTTG